MEIHAVDAGPEPSRAVVQTGVITEHVHDAQVTFTADVLVLSAEGDPVAGAAIVDAYNRDGGEIVPRELGRSDRDGRWRAARTERQLSLRAALDGTIASQCEFVSTDSPCVLRLGGQAGSVHGTVFDANGAPVAKAMVAFAPTNGTHGRAVPIVVLADERGHYRCGSIASGSLFVLARLPGPGSRPIVIERALVGAELGAATDLYFGRGASIRAKLRRADGSPVINFSVAVRALDVPSSFRIWSWRSALTDAHGECVLDSLVPGHHEVSASAGFQAHRERIELRAGERREWTHLFSRPQPLAIEVVDAGGAPLPGIRVACGESRFDQMQRITDAQGRTQFEGVSAGEHEVSLWREDSAFPVSRHRVSTEHTARLVLMAASSPGAIHGKVTVANGSLPKRLEALVVVANDRQPLRPVVAKAKCDLATGIVRCDGLPLGRYHLFIVDSDSRVRQLGTRFDIDVASGTATDLGTIELGTGGAQVTVRGHDVAGDAVEHLSVAITRPGLGLFGLVPSSRVSASMFALQDLVAGSYRILVWGHDVLPAFADFDVHIGATAAADITMQPGVRTELKLRGEIGLLTLHQPNGTELWLMANGDEPFVRGFVPGEYRAEFEEFDGTRHGAEFTVGDKPGAPVALLPRK